MNKLVSLLALVLLSLAAKAQVNLENGLIMYLPFNGNALDASPNGNNATVYGATLTQDQWGNPNSAYYFNGNSYMEVSNNTSLQPNSTITISARVKIGAFYDGPCYNSSILEKGGLVDNVPGNYLLRFSSSAASCTTADTITQNYVGRINAASPSYAAKVNAPYVAVGKWDCVVYTYDGSMAKLYVNGTLRHQYATTTSIGSNNDNIFIGRKNNTSYPYWFNGTMDEVRIYNRALNTDEVDSLCRFIQSPVGIKNIKESKVQIWPNPVKHELNLALINEELGGDLQIVDVTGRVMLQVEKLKNLVVSMDEIPAGIYFVTYQHGTSYMRAKIVKE